jgi:hypothetical protein
MQDGAARGDEAGEWLKRHFADDPAPEVRVTSEWRDQQPNVAAYRRVLEILFTPRTDRPAA